MNILMLTWNYPPAVGGIEQVAYYTANGLAESGHRLTVVAPALPDGQAEKASPIPVLRAKRKGIPAFLCHAFWSGRRLIRREKPDILLCPSLTSAPAAWCLSKLTGTPYAVQIHGSDILLANRLYQWGIRPLLSGAAMLFANSHNTAALLQQRGLPAERIRVVYPGVTPRPPADQEPGLQITQLIAESGQQPVLLTVGRLIKRKGILEFIRHTLPLILRERPDVLYWVVGGESKASLIHQERLWDQLETAIKEGGHESRVRLLGRLPDADLDAVYNRADLFVLPCLNDPHDVEGFGIVLLEAALHRVPGVATRCGGIPDAVEDGVTGVLVPPDNPEAMAQTITALLADPERLRQLGGQAYTRTTEQFTWAAIAKGYEKGLLEVVAPA